MKTIMRALLATTALAVSVPSVLAHDYRAGDIQIEHPWVHAAEIEARQVPVYMMIRNQGKEADALIGASSPEVAAHVEVYALVQATFSAQSAPVEKIPLPARSRTHLKPGEAYLLLVDLKKSLMKREEWPLTLHFEKAGKVPVKIMVEVPGADPFRDPNLPPLPLTPSQPPRN